MNGKNLQRAAQALTGLSYAEWEVLREQVERQFHMKFSRAEVSDAEVQEIASRIEREWAGVLK
ncbi:MAG: hypothetical protein J6M10_10375 [Clostridia bacterium]|nr:hypothetical protein [Clostridia bacterium]